MNITCAGCRSVFRVNPHLVPDVGTRARCSVCGAVIAIGVTGTIDDDYLATPPAPGVFARANQAGASAADDITQAFDVGAGVTDMPSSAPMADAVAAWVNEFDALSLESPLSAHADSASVLSASAVGETHRAHGVVGAATATPPGASASGPRPASPPTERRGATPAASTTAPGAPGIWSAATPVSSIAKGPTPQVPLLAPAPRAAAGLREVRPGERPPRPQSASPVGEAPGSSPPRVRPFSGVGHSLAGRSDATGTPDASSPGRPTVRPFASGERLGTASPGRGTARTPAISDDAPPPRAIPPTHARPLAPPPRATPSLAVPSPAVPSPAVPAATPPATPPATPFAAPFALPPRAGQPPPRTMRDDVGQQGPQPGAATPAPAVPYTTPAGKRPINPFLSSDPHLRAKRLARALVSDMLAYNPQKRDVGLRAGTLRELFQEEIRKSFVEYVDQVGRDIAESTRHFDDALNEILAGGQRIF